MRRINCRYYVRGCLELASYFKENNINNLDGRVESNAYFLGGNNTWYFRHIQDLSPNEWVEVDIYSYMKIIGSASKNKEVESEEEAASSRLKEVLNVQIGGSHYQGSAIQPIEYIIANKLNFPEGCVVKYISRHRKKNGKEDLLKVIQNVQMILADEYGVIVEFKVKED